MKTSEFDYHLPKELIAQTALEPRDESRLMMLWRVTKEIRHCKFKDIVDFLKEGDLLVLNDSKVIPARLKCQRKSGGKIEITLIRKIEESGGTLWRCLAKPSRRIRAGEPMAIISSDGNETGARVMPIRKDESGAWIVAIVSTNGMDTMKVLHEFGRAPLPPYIRRDDKSNHKADIERYQTVFARKPGAVAAPTAGMHFTDKLLEKIRAKGVKTCFVTLDVGWGSFAPVKVDTVEEHKVESEKFSVSEETAALHAQTRSKGGRIVAVGTTTVRALESAWRDGAVRALEGETDLFIKPGYQFKAIDALITNFHLPKSSLLMLTSAFGGLDFLKSAYEEAIRLRYRFYSFGDAMAIF